jgi:hypothetical protein
MTGERAKRRATQRVERAVEELIADPSLSYALAAARFQVSKHRLRCRINNRYGSLAAARTADRPDPDPARMRNCLRCGTISMLERGRYICDPCTDINRNIHEGGV